LLDLAYLEASHIYLLIKIYGVLGGFFSSPCATPVLVALLAIVAEKGSLIWEVTLLLLYSLGHSILVLIVGTSIGFVQQTKESEKFVVFNKIVKIVMGIIILFLAFYLFYIGF